jgi:hypothetical protein
MQTKVPVFKDRYDHGCLRWHCLWGGKNSECHEYGNGWHIGCSHTTEHYVATKPKWRQPLQWTQRFAPSLYWERKRRGEKSLLWSVFVEITPVYVQIHVVAWLWQCRNTYICKMRNHTGFLDCEREGGGMGRSRYVTFPGTFLFWAGTSS